MACSATERKGNRSCKLIQTGNKRIRHSLTSKFTLLLAGTFCHLLFLHSVQALDTSLCTSPLGMESGAIPDADLTASSSFELGNVGPKNGRVRVEKQGGAWCPKNQITSEAEEWLQIELHSVHVITAIETQGRFGNGHGQEFTEAFVLSYWRNETKKWSRYTDFTGNEIIKANINTYLAAKRDLNPPILTSRLRILPYSYHRRTVCLRIEIYGCQLLGGLLSYDMRQGSKRGENWNFYDNSYDGYEEGNYLTKGLGTLFDGREGPSNFKDDFYGHDRGKGWVGWKNDTSNSSSPVEIIFKFDSVREFNSIQIHTSNQFTKEVQVFEEARVYFSIGGKNYNKEPTVMRPKEDCIFEDPRYVEIKLGHRIAQYLKLQLFWKTKWMMISEISFSSQPAMGNFTETPSSPEQNTPPQSQSDASESHSGGNQITQEMINHMIIGQSPTVHEEWSSLTIVITAVISSFVAVIVVLLLILTAMVLRQKMKSRGEIPGSRNGIALHYEHHHLEKSEYQGWKATKNATTVEYQEPFVDPPYPNFNIPGNPIMNSVVENSSDSGNISGKGSLTQYYSCTLVNTPHISGQADSANEYEYAVPNELGKLLPNQFSPSKSIPNSPVTMGRRSQQSNPSNSYNFQEIGHVRILRQLGSGAFGQVYIGEIENGDKVAVKQLLKNATEKEKCEFLEEIRLLKSLTCHANIACVLAVCTENEPLTVILEYLEYDLCTFLRQNDRILPSSSEKLSLSNLIYIGGQIASGMVFMSNKNIVHRDLATRNCVIGKGLVVKISHFATETDLYRGDYYGHDQNLPLPIRWMAWESLFKGEYSSKSDVWSFGVTLWEIFSYCRHKPYPSMNNQDVIQNLRRLSDPDTASSFETLRKPQSCPRDVFQLMCDTWQRKANDRPSFWEIQSFLARKNSHFTPNISKRITGVSHPPDSSLMEQYIV